MDSKVDPIDILIVDDHPAFRYGLRRLLEAEPGMRVVGEAAEGPETIRKALDLRPHALLLDLALRGQSGLEVLRDLSEAGSHARVIILTAAIQKSEIAQALRLGARGIVLKESAIELIVESVRVVMSGRYWVGRENVSDVVQLLSRLLPNAGDGGSRRNFGITPREMEVVTAVVAGYSNREIAHKLTLSEQTIKHHITNIFDKLGVSNRMELTLFAVSHHLIDQF